MPLLDVSFSLERNEEKQIFPSPSRKAHNPRILLKSNSGWLWVRQSSGLAESHSHIGKDFLLIGRGKRKPENGSEEQVPNTTLSQVVLKCSGTVVPLAVS